LSLVQLRALLDSPPVDSPPADSPWPWSFDVHGRKQVVCAVQQVILLANRLQSRERRIASGKFALAMLAGHRLAQQFNSNLKAAATDGTMLHEIRGTEHDGSSYHRLPPTEEEQMSDQYLMKSTSGFQENPSPNCGGRKRTPAESIGRRC
jgi:hypothetical protein